MRVWETISFSSHIAERAIDVLSDIRIIDPVNCRLLGGFLFRLHAIEKMLGKMFIDLRSMREMTDKIGVFDALCLLARCLSLPMITF